MVGTTKSGFWSRIAATRGLLGVSAVMGLAALLPLVTGCPLFPGFGATDCEDNDGCTTDAAPFCLIADGETSGTCVACLGNADCDNGTFCDGAETCSDMNACTEGTAECDAESQECDEDADMCVDVCTDDTECDNGDFCDGDETCVEGLCTDGDSPCMDDEVCDEEGDACVECLVDGDCADGGTCVENACTAVAAEFSVTIDGCPGDANLNDTFSLTASASGAAGDSTSFAWSGTDNVTITGDDDDDASTVDVEITGTGTYTVTVTASDNEVVAGTDAVVSETVCADDTECPDGDTCNADGFCETPGTDDTVTELDSATDDCSGAVVNDEPIQVNAGADRSANVAFAASQPIIFDTNNLVPLLQATGFDPNAEAGDSLLFQWTVVSTPDETLQPASTVSILQPNSAGDGATSVDVLINPPGIASTQTRLKQDGTTTTLTNIPVPGPYNFMVTVTSSRGQTASDTVVRTITPTWVPQAAVGGSGAGLAANNGIYSMVTNPTTGLDLDILSLSRVTGTVDFTAQDDDTATSMQDLASVSVTPSDTPAAIMPAFPASARGTWSINAGLNSGEVSVASGNTGVDVLVGADLSSTTAGTQLDITAAQIGAPQSSAGGRLYAGRANDDLGSAANTTANSEALRGQNVLFADIKGNGDLHLIVWGGDDANNNYDAQDVRIYGPLNNQTGNMNTLDIERENFLFLEQIDTGCTVSDVAVGPLRGNAALPEIVVACNAADPLVKVYQNNGTTGLTDKVYSVAADQTTAAAPSTITFDYTNSNVANLPPTLELAPFSSTSFDDLILGDPGFDSGADGFIEGRVNILQGGTAGAIPAAGFSQSTGAAYANLPNNKWDTYSGVGENGTTTDADDEPFFGFSLATGLFTSTSQMDIYVGAPGNDAATQNSVDVAGSVYRIPAGSALNSTDAESDTLAVGWDGEADGDQFGFNIATTASGQVCVGATQNGHTANNANGNGKIYVYPAATANAAGAGTIPGLAGEQASDFFGQRLATGSFEGSPVLLAASPGGNYVRIIQTGGTLSNPIVAQTKVTITDVDTSQNLVIGDFNGDGKNDILTSEQDADLVTALWGRS